MSNALGPFVSTSTVAQRLGIHRVNAAALVRSGKLPAVKVGRTWVIDARDLDAFAETYTKGPGPHPEVHGKPRQPRTNLQGG